MQWFPYFPYYIAVRMGCQSVECIKFYIGDVVLRGKNRWINWICIIAIRTTLEIIGSVAKTIFHTNWENSCSTAWMRRIYWHTILNDGQPKLRASGVVVPLVCEYPRDPEGIWGVFQPKLAISRGAVKHWCTVWPQSSSFYGCIFTILREGTYWRGTQIRHIEIYAFIVTVGY